MRRCPKHHIVFSSIKHEHTVILNLMSVAILDFPGLDPAEPDFVDTDNAVHLEKTDATFVDIIHSDGSEFDYVSGKFYRKNH